MPRLRAPARLLLLLIAATHALPGSAPAAAPDEALERTLQAHLTFLADDRLEGRAAGTRGYELAARYVAAHFTRLGLQPAGDAGTWLQAVRFVSSQSDLEAGRLTVHAAGADTPLVAVNDVLVRPSIQQAQADVRAEAVFVGFGIHAPTFGYDDFGSIDVRGKIAVVLAGSPDTLPATARAHHSRRRPEELARRGAIGLITVMTPRETQRSPWAVTLNGARFLRLALLTPDGTVLDDHPGIRATATVNLTAAAALFAPGPRPVAEVFAAAARGEPQAFPLGVEISLGARATPGELRCHNVLALLPGSDPALAGEPVVLTTHLDHLGIGPASDGDTIYNGAYDNAIGSAMLLAVAERLAALPPSPRPILFATVTAEEKGLLGSRHLALYPPGGVTRYAANVNIDMALFLAPTTDVTGIGAEHSSLGASLARVAAAAGLGVSPDPQPEEVVFVRSDQYSFIREGVPALFLKAGQRGRDPAVDVAALERAFRRERYHRPGDDLSQPFDWPSAGAFTRLTAELLRTVAAEPTPPAWLPGDFFGETFGRP